MIGEEEIINEEEWTSVEDDIIDEVKSFAKRASENDHDFYKRVKNDRAFAAGEQWGDDDKTNRGDNRAELTINLCNVFINAVVNPFNAKPFKFRAVPRWSKEYYANFYTKRIAEEGRLWPEMVQTEGSLNDEIVKLNDKLTAIQNDFGTNESNTLAFADAVTTGIGFTYATIEEVLGEKKIKYNHVEDQTMVVVAPEAKGVALEDSDQIAVIDFMLYDKAKEKFGEDIVESREAGQAKLTDFGSNWEVPKDNVAIVTYYRKDGHDVEYFRLCGDHIVDYGKFDGLEYLPIFAFTGDRIWLSKKRTYSGMIRKIKAEQKTINYAQSQLIERLAKSPKGFFLGYTESFEGHEDEVQNACFGNSQIVSVNARTEGFTMPNKMPIPMPQFVEPHVITEDLQAIINQEINHMSVATGVSANGIVEQNLTDQKTATEVLLRTKSSQSNVSNYVNRAKESIRIAGNVIAHLAIMLYGIELPKGSYDIVVEEGCVSLTKMEEDREKLLALAQIVPDSFKPLISQHIVKTLDIEGGDQLATQLYNMLPAELRGGLPSMQEFQAQQLEMQNLQQTIVDLQGQLKNANDQLTQAQLRTQTDIILENQRFKHDVQKMVIQNSENERLDAKKVLLDAAKDKAKSEQELNKIALDNKAKVTEKAMEIMADSLKQQSETPPPFTM